MTEEHDPTAARECITITVPGPQEGKRLDKYLVAKLPEYSRTFLQKLIARGRVHVNGRRSKSSHEICTGDRLEVWLPSPRKPELEPEDVPLEILYEDEHLIAVNKHDDIVVHPARGHLRGTMVHALLHHCSDLSNLYGDSRPGVVHRLDRHTTGVILFAKSDAAHHRLGRQFEARQVEKTYLTIVEGEPELDADIINLPIGKHLSHSEKVAIRFDVGKEAITIYQVRERFRGFARVECTPKTGRTHQIRIHLRTLGHPVVADHLYGYRESLSEADLVDGGSPEPLIQRQALHAHRLALRHPATDAPIEFVAPIPEDMQRLLDALRKHRRLDSPSRRAIGPASPGGRT